MPKNKIALATCRQDPNVINDDLLLVKAFAARNFEAVPLVWPDLPDADTAGVVVRSCWDYILARPEFLSWTRQVALTAPIFNSPDTIAWSSDKRYLRELEAQGVPVVPTLWLASLGERDRVLAEAYKRGWQSVVVKPAADNHAAGLIRGALDDIFSRSDELAASLEKFGGALLLQPYLPAVEDVGEWKLIFFDRTFSHAVRKFPEPGESRSQLRRAAHHGQEEAPALALDVACRAITAAPEHLYARVDLLPLRDGFAVSELAMVEPQLYFDAAPGAADRLADLVVRKLSIEREPLHLVANAEPDQWPQSAIEAQLKTWHDDLSERTHRYLGYPNNTRLEHQNLAPFLDLVVNNVGDPYAGNNGIATFEAERDVVAFFADALGAPADDRWGYVTNGGTESNLQGLWAARSRYPDAVVYYSESTHYSIYKNLSLLGLKGARIACLPNGAIDPAQLERVAHGLRDYPAIWHANCGTTMTGAFDNLAAVQDAFARAGIERLHIHCDAALAGGYLPFLPEAPCPSFRDGVASFAISGHKFPGSPIPCGVLVARPSLADVTSRDVSYIHSRDRTISGSRDGFSVLVLWQELRRRGKSGLAAAARACLELTSHTVDLLREIGVEAWANPWSITVVLMRPSEILVRRWHLATEGDWAHIVILPGVTMAMIDTFVAELAIERLASESKEVRHG